MIRITLVRDKFGSAGLKKTIIVEFADPAEAATWFVENSYFSEPYTVSATWERVDGEVV